MIDTNLVGQYLVVGDEPCLEYHKIVAVTINTPYTTVWTKNLKNKIESQNLQGCVIVRETPHQVEVSRCVAELQENPDSRKDRGRKALEAYQAAVQLAETYTSD